MDKIRPRQSSRPGSWLGALFLLVLLAVTSCTSNGGRSYHDKVYHFSLGLPSGWIPPKAGTTGTTTEGINSYVVHFVQPPGFRIVVRLLLTNLSGVPNGKVLHHPTGGCPGTCYFYRVTVDGFPAILIRQYVKASLQEEDLDLNSRSNGYEIEFAGYPGVTSKQNTQFQHLIHSFKVGPKG